MPIARSDSPHVLAPWHNEDFIVQAIETRASECQVIEDPWLSGVLDCLAGRVDYRSDRPGTVIDWQAAFASFLGKEKSSEATLFLSAKVDTQDVNGVAILSQAGMYVVDVNVTLERRIEIHEALVDHPSKGNFDDLLIARVVDPSTPTTQSTTEIQRDRDSCAAFVDLAANAFRYSRFHLDPAVPKSAADEVKASWFKNALLGHRGDQVWLAWFQGRPAGFLTSLFLEPTEADSNGTAVIDLVAVASEARGEGVGRALTEQFVAYYRHRHVSCFRVGTQVANLPAQKLYLSCGFRPVQATYVLHGHQVKVATQ